MNLIFLGPPGAGKGTQAAKVAEKYDIPHISTGNMLRAAMQEGTELGVKAKAFVDAGNLVPDEVVIGIVEERLQKADCEKGYILDGFPRTVEQAKALDGFASIKAAILVDVDDNNLIKRLAGRRTCKNCSATYHINSYSKDTCEVCDGELIQRADDKEETVKNRLKVYHSLTSPLIEFYEEKGILKRVDGMLPIEKVLEDIIGIVDDIK